MRRQGRSQGPGGPVGEGETPAGRRLPRAARIRGEGEIRHVVRSGDRRVHGPLEVYRLRSPARRPRIAVIVPLHGHGAVERNTLRRRVRELLRVEWLPEAWERGEAVDLVVRARREAYDLPFSRLETHLKKALHHRA